jgi:hypothetical protein
VLSFVYMCSLRLHMREVILGAGAVCLCLLETIEGLEIERERERVCVCLCVCVCVCVCVCGRRGCTISSVRRSLLSVRPHSLVALFFCFSVFSVASWRCSVRVCCFVSCFRCSFLLRVAPSSFLIVLSMGCSFFFAHVCLCVFVSLCV